MNANPPQRILELFIASAIADHDEPSGENDLLRKSHSQRECAESGIPGRHLPTGTRNAKVVSIWWLAMSVGEE